MITVLAYCKSQSGGMKTWEAVYMANRALASGSICHMKRNTHFIVPAAKMQLKQGREQLSEYQVQYCKA